MKYKLGDLYLYEDHYRSHLFRIIDIKPYYVVVYIRYNTFGFIHEHVMQMTKHSFRINYAEVSRKI